MSSDSGDLEKGCTVYFDNKKKTVRDWFFVSDDGCHNSDRIVIRFTDGTDNEGSGWAKVQSVKEWTDELMELEDKAFSGGVLPDGTVIPAGIGAISPEMLEFLKNGPDVDVSKFVKKRHLEHLQFTHYKGSWNDLIAQVKKQMKLGNYSKGYRDGVLLVHMDKDEAPLFYGFDGFKKFEGMKMDAVVEKVPGREHEPAKLQIRIKEPKIRMRYVDIILYRRDVLLEDGDDTTGADWEVISINGRLNRNPPPMEALTMVRNYRHLPGGTAMPGKDPVEFLDELMDAVLYEKGMKHLIKKKK